ncbi:MAG: hypothetical protein GY828_01200 [Candidatus Gracilibacteria bacterium]|nr:hypothetical protein [Candidatus Gracilibacteria bacterium]
MINIDKKIKEILGEGIMGDEVIESFLQEDNLVFIISNESICYCSGIERIAEIRDDIDEKFKSLPGDSIACITFGVIEIIDGKLHLSVGVSGYEEGSPTDNIWYIQKQLNKIGYTLM